MNGVDTNHSILRNALGQKLGTSICFLFLLSQVGACSSSKSSQNVVDVQIASQFQVGTSLADVQSMLGSHGEFGFLTAAERGETLGLEYKIRPTGTPMFFVFENRALRSIVRVPPKEVALRPRKNNVLSRVVVPRNPNTVLRSVLESESYMGQDLIEQEESTLESRGQPQGQPEIIPNNLLPAILASALCPGILVVAIGQELDRPRVQKELEVARRRWEYHRIGLGMSQREVELVFGQPSLEQSVGRIRGCVYGDKRKGVDIAVEYYDGHVRSVFGRRFLHFDWTGELRKSVLDSCLPPKSSQNDSGMSPEVVGRSQESH